MAPHVNSGSSQRPQALLFLCHRAEEGFLNHFKSLAKSFRRHGDSYFIFDSSTSGLPDQLRSVPHFEFSMESLRALGYHWLQDSLMPGHVHFPVLAFARNHPEYSHYWVIEYDVRLTGPWRLFFRMASRNRTDFVATHLSRYPEQPSWYWWDTYSCPDMPISVEDRIRFFGPLYRISRPAIEFVDEKLRSGCRGHQEVVLPSLLNEVGFSLTDLSGISSFRCLSFWSWYTRSKRDVWGALANSSMRFRPPMDLPGYRPFTFYHPIKNSSYGLPALISRVFRRARPEKPGGE